MQAEVLDSPASAQRFYEKRYAQGYMDRWEADRFERIGSALAHIELPASARILDFGCGSGALTRLLVARWPDAEVHGADISGTAVAHARERSRDTGVRFHGLDAAFVREYAGRFDFVFSHHVLEHVYDLGATVGDLVGLLAPSGRMLHALPCGNRGSLAHWLCQQRPDGIDERLGNRFFFEESSHLRRLRSEELAAAFAPHGCTLQSASYGYHQLGVLRLMTELRPTEWFAMLDPRHCHRRCLPPLLALLLVVALVAALRAPCLVLQRCRRLLQQVLVFRSRRWHERSTLLLLLLAVPSLLLAPASLPIELCVRWADRREWRRRRQDPAGSEMMLAFALQPTLPPATGAPARQSTLLPALGVGTDCTS